MFRKHLELKMYRKYLNPNRLTHPIISKLLRCYIVPEKKETPAPPAPPAPRLMTEGDYPIPPKSITVKDKANNFLKKYLKW